MKHNKKKQVLMLSSVASMMDQFNLPNIRLLQELNYEVHVACNFKEGNTCDRQQIDRLLKMLRQMGVTAHQWDCPRKIYPARVCIRAYGQLRKLAESYDFEWIHCHSPIGGVLARLAAHKQKIKVIYTAHGFHFYQGAPIWNWMLYYPIEKALARWTDVLITVNKEDYHFARGHLKAGKIYHIPGVGIETKKFQAPLKYMDITSFDQRKWFCRKFQIPENAVVLLSVGELNKGKNHRMVILALSKLQRKDIYYLICGQGPMRKKLQHYAEHLGVEGRIRMPGFQNQMPWIYQNADIFVFPSMREGMPAAVMEAMSAGLPCVVSDIRGCRELIGSPAEKRSGIIFSLKHPYQLAAALDALIENEPLRKKYGKRGQKKIQSYDQGIVKKKMKAIYMYMCHEVNADL